MKRANWIDYEEKLKADLDDGLSLRDIHEGGDYPFSYKQLSTKIQALKKFKKVDVVNTSSLGPNQEKVLQVLKREPGGTPEKVGVERFVHPGHENVVTTYYTSRDGITPTSTPQIHDGARVVLQEEGGKVVFPFFVFTTSTHFWIFLKVFEEVDFKFVPTPSGLRVDWSIPPPSDDLGTTLF